MRALLLAAGLGTRLRPWTDDRPKAMVPVAGTPVLQRQVEWLRELGIRELAINLHHHPDAVTSHFGDGSSFGVRIRYSHEPELLGTGGALAPLAEWLRADRFLVVYADNLVRVDVARLCELHDRLGATATVALFEREDVSASGVAEIDAERVVRLVEKPGPGETDSHWVNAGLVLCEPPLLDHVPPPPSDLAGDVLPALIRGGLVVGGYRMGPGESLDWIDTPADLERVAGTVAMEESR